MKARIHVATKSMRIGLILSLVISSIIPVIPAKANGAVRLDDPGFDTITGTLAGRVIDAAGAPVPAVRVRAINQETGNQRATLTNAEGRYQIAFLPLGRYSIQATKDGLEISQPTKEPIKIQLNKLFETVPDIIMKPVLPPVIGLPTPPTPPTPTTPPVVPRDDAAGRLTDLNDATRRSNADESQVSLLPLSGIRSFDDLALLAAGVAPPPEVKGVAGPGIGSGIGTAGQFAVNGQRARSNNFTVDGSDNNDEDIGVRRQGFVTLVPQSIESVREIQIVSHLWDAEQGRSIGSQVNAVSRSGTNQIHGSIYDFFNHESLNARNFFDYNSDKSSSYALSALAIDRFNNGVPVNPRSLPVVVRSGSQAPAAQLVQPNPSLGKDQYQRNQGGAAIGFPLRRDRTFFFGSFERQQIKARQESHFSVPTVAQRGFLNFGATGFSIGGQGQPISFAPTFVAGDSIFSLFPFPNNPIGPYGENTYTQVLPADAEATIFSLKLDHELRILRQIFGNEGTHNFTARYNFTNDSRQVPSVGGGIFAGVEPRVRTQNLSLFLTSQISPTLANQLRASYGRTRLRFAELRDPRLTPSRLAPQDGFLLNTRRLANLTTPEFPLPYVDYRTSSAAFDTEGNLGPVGQVTISPFSPVGLDVYLFPQSRANNTIQLADTLTSFRGQQTLKLGADLRRTQLNSLLNRNYRPQFFFAGSPDLTCQIQQAPIKEITRFGPTPSPTPGTCAQPGYFNGSDLAALGIPTGIFQSLALGNADSTIGLRFWQINLFANDNWRAGKGLTLDFGMRYELNTVPGEVNRRIEDTFGLGRIPTPDDAFRISAPFSRGQIVFNNSALISSLNQTLGALRNVLDGRSGIYDTDANNVGGHFSFAWDPWASGSKQAGKSSIRGGIGAYYDLTLGSVVSQSRNVFPTFIPFNVDVNTFSYARDAFFQPGLTGIFAVFNPRFVPFDIVNNGQVTRFPLIRERTLNTLGIPNGAVPAALGLLFNPAAAGQTASGGGLAFTLPDRRLRAPIALQYNLQFERELPADLLMTIGYVGSRGVRLTRFRTPNGGPNSITLPVDPLGLTNNPIFALSFAPLSIGTGRSGRPNPGLGSYTIFDSSSSSTYHSLQASLTRRMSRGYQVGVSYTWSHAIDDVSDVFDVAGASSLPQDDRNLRLERGSAGFDVRHRLTLSLIGNLPLLSRFNDSSGPAGLLLGGWQWASIVTAQSGQPFTINSSYDVNLDGNLTDRLDTTAGITEVNNGRNILSLNVSPLSLLAGLGQNGRIGRNTFRAPGVFRTDASLNKTFRIREGQSILFKVEAFNLWNRTHFAIPVRLLEAPGFGRSVDTLVAPRQIQVALKYVF